MPKTYLCIGSYYGGERLAKLLDVLRKSNFPDFAILVNEQLGAKREPSGFAKIYNALLDCAFADKQCLTMWILNDDILPQPGCLERCTTEILSDPTLGAVAPAMAWLAEGIPTTITPTEPYRYLPMSEFEGGREEIIYPGFGCAVIRREAWKAVGPMDESLGRGYAEDLDWGIRCWKAGFRVLAFRDVWFLHELGGTFGQLVKEGKYDAEEPSQAAVKCKEKWKGLRLWEKSSAEILTKLRAWREEALKSR